MKISDSTERWEPIECCPSGTNVEVGKWHGLKDQYLWVTDIGMPFKSAFFGLLRQRCYLSEYSHWRHLPSPPASS